MEIVEVLNAEHYLWGNGCDGWHLLNKHNLSIITERVPAGESESAHFHILSRQFFYMLTGEATIEVDGKSKVLRAHQGIEIPPNTIHQFRNDSDREAIFLVISVPKSHGDRIEV